VYLVKKTEIVEEQKEEITKESIKEELKRQNQVLISLKAQVEKMITINENFMEKIKRELSEGPMQKYVIGRSPQYCKSSRYSIKQFKLSSCGQI